MAPPMVVREISLWRPRLPSTFQSMAESWNGASQPTACHSVLGAGSGVRGLGGIGLESGGMGIGSGTGGGGTSGGG